MNVRLNSILVLIFAFTLPSAALGQMEKRNNENYQLTQFVNSFPTIGDKAPELELVTLAGKKVKLSEYQGKRVILIKGGYT